MEKYTLIHGLSMNFFFGFNDAQFVRKLVQAVRVFQTSSPGLGSPKIVLKSGPYAYYSLPKIFLKITLELRFSSILVHKVGALPEVEEQLRYQGMVLSCRQRPRAARVSQCFALDIQKYAGKIGKEKEMEQNIPNLFRNSSLDLKICKNMNGVVGYLVWTLINHDDKFILLQQNVSEQLRSENMQKYVQTYCEVVGYLVWT